MKLIKNNLYYLSGMYYNLDNKTQGGSYMVNFLNVQFSIFGVYADIKATTQNIVKIMEELDSKKFLPNTITSQNIDISTNKFETENRISFITQDQICNFVILNDRIDVNYNFPNVAATDPNEALQKFKAEATEIYNTLIGLFNIKSNRLALNVKILGNNSIKGRENHYYNNFINGFTFYKDKEILEWGYNTNSRVEINLNSGVETLNVITNLGMVTNFSSQDKRLLCHFDINTIGENVSNRFGGEELKSFFDNIDPILMDLIKNFMESEEHDK